ESVYLTLYIFMYTCHKLAYIENRERCIMHVLTSDNIKDPSNDTAVSYTEEE
ncbi:hypothetical protein ACJX0J_033814, partial [Zea mays]